MSFQNKPCSINPEVMYRVWLLGGDRSIGLNTHEWIRALMQEAEKGILLPFDCP